MQWSVVDLSNVESCFTFRWDSEFFHPITLSYQSLLESKNPSYLLDAIIIHPTEFKREYSNTGKKLLLSSNIGVNFLDDEFAPLIEPERASKLGLDEVKNGDELVVRTGAIGLAASFRSTCEKAYASCDTIIIRNTQFLCGYLSSFFHSKYGNKMLERGKYGLAQPHILPSYLRTIPITVFSKDLEIKIDNLIENSFCNLSQSKNYLKQGETLLLTELGLENWQPKKQLSFVANYADVEDSNRFDADYFQPHYKELLERIREQQVKLHNFSETVQLRDKNYQPIADKEYRYIELSNIGGNGEITGFSKELGQDLPSRARRIVRKGDVIISSIKGSIDSVALISDKEDGALCSTGFYVAHSEIYNPETLLILLKSIVGQLQLKRGCNGTILTAISKDELNRLKLPEIHEAIQGQLKQLVQQMYDERDASKHLLETAKRAVEIAIEKDEGSAQKYIATHSSPTTSSHH